MGAFPKITTTYPLVEHIIKSLKDFALRDIKKIGKEDTVLASFILCSCFIEQVSGFRYVKTGHKPFTDFVKEYLPSHYNPNKLRDDLRNKLVHNYSLGNSYSLVREKRELHLTMLGGRQIINIENFIEELDTAFTLYENDLNTKEVVRNNAFKWYKKHKIIGMNNHDFLSFKDAEKMVIENSSIIGEFSKDPSWGFYLKNILIVPSGSQFETMGKIVKYAVGNNCSNKDALIGLSIYEENAFDVYILGTDKEEVKGSELSFIKMTDYLEWCKAIS